MSFPQFRQHRQQKPVHSLLPIRLLPIRLSPIRQQPLSLLLLTQLLLFRLLLPRRPPPSRRPPPLPRSGPGTETSVLTIALLGSDGGFDRRGVRTDTIILFSIDMATGDAVAFNIPRNWRDLPFPAGTPASERWPDGYPGIANAIYGLGLRFPEVFPDVDDPAGYAIKLALAQLTGLRVQYYVLVDMVGFVEIIDLFGGIGVYVMESINDRIKPIVRGGPHIDIDVKPGEHHFDGLTALGYVRSRTASSDYRRMTRQRWRG